MIEKPSIIITSLGRTGTKFLSGLFSDIIEASSSLHEPDSFLIGLGHYSNKDALRRAQIVGIKHMMLKAVGRWRLIEISDDRFRGSIDDAKAKHEISRQREEFIAGQSGDVYVESNAGFYGVLDILPWVFEFHRAVFIVRNGIDWVRSEMNWGEIYGKGKVRSLFAHTWPTACDLKHDSYRYDWGSMSRFSRLCWAWTALNSFALKTLPLNENARLFHFEDIFESEKRHDNLKLMIEHLAALPNVKVRNFQDLAEWLNKPRHQSMKIFPSWDGWSLEEKEQFRTICGPLMNRLGYDFD
jgi:hypothetical protein